MSDHPSVPTSPASPESGSPRRHLLIVLVSAILTAQLVPTGLTTSSAPPPAPITSVVPIPADVEGLLRRSCYDCHSHATVIPWYGAVQPVGGWIAGHVKDGRQELNFDEFGAYRPRRQYRKLEQIAGEVRSDAMPLPSYLLLHGTAHLAEAERALLYAWVDSSLSRLRQLHPPDSLQRRR